jgi:hypothetical protein
MGPHIVDMAADGESVFAKPFWMLAFSVPAGES